MIAHNNYYELSAEGINCHQQLKSISARKLACLNKLSERYLKNDTAVHLMR